jgi:L-ribulose-5-phosphate 3-epimerase
MSEHGIPVIGIYEKALPLNKTWDEMLKTASDAGYGFIEMSIDETDERLSRLDWDIQKKAELKKCSMYNNMPILSMCLSGHRRFPIGSTHPEIRDRGMDIMKKAIGFSADIGIRIIQLAAYDVFYNEKSTEETKGIFYENLQKSVEWASQYGITLALETMDVDHTNSITKLMDYVRRINSPWLQIYPDIGNLTSADQDIVIELLRGEGHIVAIHIKDARKGVIRKVPFGEGLVDFSEAFSLLKRTRYRGPLLIEMWNDESDDPVEEIKNARQWVIDKWNSAD